MPRKKFKPEKWKNLKNLVTQNLEFIGFMVFKTTVSDSRITSFLWFSKLSTRAREICKILVKNWLKNGRKMKISHDVLHSFENRKKLVIRESETVVLNTMNPMKLKFCVTRFFRFFVFPLILGTIFMILHYNHLWKFWYKDARACLRDWWD